MDWKPIETAPKDGTRVLLWDERWQDARIGEWRADMWWLDDDGSIISATHWMPLPPSPTNP